MQTDVGGPSPIQIVRAIGPVYEKKMWSRASSVAAAAPEAAERGFGVYEKIWGWWQIGRAPIFLAAEKVRASTQSQQSAGVCFMLLLLVLVISK